MIIQDTVVCREAYNGPVNMLQVELGVLSQSKHALDRS